MADIRDAAADDRERVPPTNASPRPNAETDARTFENPNSTNVNASWTSGTNVHLNGLLEQGSRGSAR